MEIRSNLDEISKKDQLIGELRQELAETRHQLDEVVMSRKSEGTALLQIDHYKADNERLLKMLGSTKEFEHFGKIASDLGNVRYMDPQKQPSTCHYPKKHSVLNEFNQKEEVEDWIPEEAFKVAHDFRNKCASSV